MKRYNRRETTSPTVLPKISLIIFRRTVSLLHLSRCYTSTNSEYVSSCVHGNVVYDNLLCSVYRFGFQLTCSFILKGPPHLLTLVVMLNCVHHFFYEKLFYCKLVTLDFEYFIFSLKHSDKVSSSKVLSVDY